MEKGPRDREGSSHQRYNGRNIPEPKNCSIPLEGYSVLPGFTCLELGNFVLILRKKKECGKQRKGRELLTERNRSSSRNVRKTWSHVCERELKAVM